MIHAQLRPLHQHVNAEHLPYVRAVKRLPYPLGTYLTKGQDLFLLETVEVEHTSTTELTMTARTREYETLPVSGLLRALNAAHPALPAWVLSELDRAFRLTTPLTTPGFLLDLIITLSNQTPAARRNMYRKRENKPRARTRFTEMDIARQGYLTTASPILHLGHWLCRVTLPPNSTEGHELLQQGGPRLQDLSLLIQDALNVPIPGSLTPHPAPHPAYTLTYTDDDEGPADTFVQDVIEHLQQVWRYHDGTFSTLTTTRPAHGRAFMKAVTTHQHLIHELRGLL